MSDEIDELEREEEAPAADPDAADEIEKLEAEMQEDRD